MKNEHVSVPREELEMMRDELRAGSIGRGTAASRLDDILSRATPSDAISKEAQADLVSCDWQEGALFYVTDDPDEHKPCYLVMPDGACLTLNHHATNGVDQARAKFIADCCNQVLCLIQEPMKPGAPRVVTAEAVERSLLVVSDYCSRNKLLCPSWVDAPIMRAALESFAKGND